MQNVLVASSATRIVALRALPAAARVLRARSAAKSGAPSATTPTGRKPVPGFGDPRRACCSSGWRRPRTARTAPAASSPATARRLWRLPDGGAAPRGLRQHPDVARSDDGLAAARRVHRRGGALRPPDNKPTPEEIAQCLPHLEAEVAALPRVRVVVALGRIAFDAYLQLLKRAGRRGAAAAAFGHGSIDHLPNGLTLIGCYHPSRQNTNTGKLTAGMMDDVFRRAARTLAAL